MPIPDMRPEAVIVGDSPCCKDLRQVIKRMQAAVDDLTARVHTLEGNWSALRLEITTPNDGYLDYQKLDHSFDLMCPDTGDFLVGWGYGSAHNDARAWYRRITLKKTP